MPNYLQGIIIFHQNQKNRLGQFCEIGTADKKTWNNTIITTVSKKEHCVWVYKPIGSIREENKSNKTYENIHVKSIPIKLLKREQLKEVPLTLGTCQSNRYLQSGTFANLSELAKKDDAISPHHYQGNIEAIKYLWKDKYLGNTEAIINILKDEDKEINKNFWFLYLLSSLELEVLIAKLFEENKFFVHNYKGGNLKHIDLIVRNFSNKDRSLGHIKVKSKFKYFCPG